MELQKHLIKVEELGIVFSTGSLAKLANGAVTIQLGDTIVFVSAVAAEKVNPDQNFFPLMVDYRERYAAAGRFPGGYFKREGKPSEKEVLTSRLCDRPLRPLFPEGFMNEVQVIGMLLSADLENEPDVLMVNGASAALMCSDIPFHGPIGCVRIAEVKGEFVVNPTNDQLFDSKLDLIYVGNEKDMMMIEGSADQLSDERFVEALEFAHEKIQPLLKAQRELARLVGAKKREFPLVQMDQEVFKICSEVVKGRLIEALFQEKKREREAAVSVLKEEATERVKAALGEEKFEAAHVDMVFDKLQEEVYRSKILEEGARADGRKPKDIREILCKTGLLPKVHGSSLFQRGETQALVLTTLGTTKDVQELDALTGGAQSKSFILHYNFPPFSVGETGRTGAAGRREIGHGALAERSLLPVIPSDEVFPYSIRLVSEIMESNGSSSMATVCGGCLALMDAGVPIVAPVAGISTGLVTQTDKTGAIKKHILLTDILGSEDFFGDMDFKIAGTRKGITGFQLDLKLKGLPLPILKEAVFQNRDARMKILDIMAETLAEPRKELNKNAPRIHEMRIDPEKIGALIGPGGKNIKRITEVTGAQIDINEDNSGRLYIFTKTEESLQRAIKEVQLCTGEIEVGKTYHGKVQSVKEFGAFVECLPGKDGLVHISELAEFPVDRTEDICQVGDEMSVKCIGIDEKGRVRLSRRAVLCEEQGMPYEAKSRGGGGGGRGEDRPSRGRDSGSRERRHFAGDRSGR